MPLPTKSAFKQMIIDNDAAIVDIVRDHPGLAIDLLEDLLVETGHKLKTGFRSIADRRPDRFVFDPSKVPTKIKRG